jgi:hypothetical protein
MLGRAFELMVLAQRGPHRLAQQVILIRRKLARWSGRRGRVTAHSAAIEKK